MSVEMVKLEDEVAEKEIKSTIVSLDKHFSDLMVVVRLALDHKLQHQQLLLVEFTTWIEQRMDWVGQLNNINDLNKIFQKLHPYFDFIDCDLIVDMSERFLNDEYFGKEKKSLISELKEHMTNAETLCCSSTVKELKHKLKSVYSQYLADLSNMPKIHIELNNKWNEATIKKLYLLIGHLLPYKSKQSILNHIDIETGSVSIKYVVIESNADCLIAYVQDKLQFMRLIGIFGLTVNDKSILEEYENMNFTFESALLEAANLCHNEALNFLLILGVNVDHCNEEGRTALMIASKFGDEQVVKTMVSAGANVNIQDNEGWTALMITIVYASHWYHNCYTQVVEQVLKERADVNIQNKNGYTALMIASQSGHFQIIKQLLKEHADVNIQENEGWTALMIASQNGHFQVIEQLLKEHADVNVQSNDGWTALMVASQNGHAHVIEQLLKEHAGVNIQNENGYTALIIASQNGHFQIVEQLLKEYADVNIQTNDGWTALIVASQNGHTQVIEQILKEDLDVNVQNKEGVTALIKASQYGHTQVVEQLLKEDADVNIRNRKGVTALMLASANGHVQVVELLAKELIDIDVVMKDGSTALMLACYYGHVEVAECLLKSFADPHIIAYNGSTAFSLAAYSGNNDLVNMLLDKAEPTTDEIEKAVVASCYGGHPTLITFLSNKLPHLTNDQRELLDSCVKGDLGTVVWKTLDSPDTSLVLGLTPLMIASSCGHVDIVDALIQAGADVNKQESHFGFTPLAFAERGSKLSSVTESLLMYGAHPNVIADNNTPLDVANEETIRELLISYGGQTISQLQGKKKYGPSKLQLSLPTLHEKTITKSLLTMDEIKDITMSEESSYSF